MAAETDDAFRQLNDTELAALTPLGVRRAVSAGEYLYREGDPDYDFYVVLSGAVEIVVNPAGEERVIARHSPGRFLGELNLLTGQRVFVSARVAEPGEVLAVPRDALRHVIATNAGLSDKILAAFLARRAILLTGASSAIRVIGSRFSADSSRVREFLVRNRIPHDWLDPDADSDVERLLREFDIAPRELPVVIVSGKVLRRPTPGVLADYLGLTVGTMPDGGFDLIVVGAGPAGLAAAVYGASEGLRTLMLEMVAVGGQAGSSSRIENYLGFPTGISGGDLTQRAIVQAQKFGASLSSPCTVASLREEAGHFVLRLSNGTDVPGRAVIIATGARYKRLEAVGLERFECVNELCTRRTPVTQEIPPAVRQAILRDYHMEHVPSQEYELDYLITPELGGVIDRRNLWPERYGASVWNARVKDDLERLLPQLVCQSTLDLATAQQDLAVDWIAAYKKYFHSDRPVETQASRLLDEDDDVAPDPLLESAAMWHAPPLPYRIALVSLTTPKLWR